MVSNHPPSAAGQDLVPKGGIITMQVMTGRTHLALLLAWLAFAALVTLLG
ncbi:hypothetical protein [Streptosporangium sp. NPDC002524]